MMRRTTGFRKIAARGHQHLNPAFLQDLVVHRLDDLLAFTSVIWSRPRDAQRISLLVESDPLASFDRVAVARGQ